MATYIESGLRVDLPDGQHFRFADLPAYKKLSGCYLKEMDFAWINGEKLFLLEVRSYAKVTTPLTAAHFVPVTGQPAPYRYKVLIDKVTDSLLMMLATWAGSARGQAIGNGLPVGAKTRLPLKLIIAVDLPAHLSTHMQGLRDCLNASLRGRIALADVRHVAVLDYARLVADPQFSPFITLHP